MSFFEIGTVVPVTYLSGRNGDPFVLLREEIEDIREELTPEQETSWQAILEIYKTIEEDLEEVADFMYEGEIFSFMEEFAPAGCVWGPHPDGGCLGFWPDDWE